mmetsp:Transcript_11103/g.27284  ORF Transcript_11103/g.27284 Transcript_11103/m.27284 type:complete len:343 (-) Transcript_11103:287-1315(-)
MPGTEEPPKPDNGTKPDDDPTKTENSSYYFFKSTPAHLQKQYAPVPLKDGEKLDFTPRVQTIHDAALVKKAQELKEASEKQKTNSKVGGLSYSQIRKNAYDFRDKVKEEEKLKEPEKYDVGQKVVLHGLKKAAKYNNQVAVVLAEMKDGRYPVKIDDKKQLNVKRENLKLYRPVICKEFVDIELKRGFRCTPELLFRALTDEEMVGKYTQSECKIYAKLEGTFSLFGGSIHGMYKEFVAPSLIGQKWRFREWPDDHFSDVTIKIESPEYGVTVATLIQKNVPVHDKYRNRDVPQKVKKGWKQFIFDRIHKIVGFAKVDKREWKKSKKNEDDDDDDDDADEEK